MSRWALLFVLLLAFVASSAHAQLFFHTGMDKYEHPKSAWERWSKTKVGDYIEFSDGKQVFARFEVIEIGDHQMKVRTTTNNEFLKRIDARDIVHVFTMDDPKFGLPTSVSDDKLKLGDKEFAAKKEAFLFDKKPVKEVWYSDDAPFDGMLKYLQYQQGTPSAERFASSFKKGEVVFGKPDEALAASGSAKPKPETKPAPQPDPKPEPKPEPAENPPADIDVRVWTSANGKDKIEAKLIRATATAVVLQRTSDGKEFTLRLNQLSKEDREFLKELSKKPK